jgi:hypothetical protein
MKDITGEAVQEFVSSSTVSPKMTRNIFVTPQSMWSSGSGMGMRRRECDTRWQRRLPHG